MPFLRLKYKIDGIEVDDMLALVSPQASSAPRWLFRCPIQQTSVGKLFLPPGARHFASRRALGLTYRYCLQSRPLSERINKTALRAEISGVCVG